MEVLLGAGLDIFAPSGTPDTGIPHSLPVLGLVFARVSLRLQRDLSIAWISI
jgi:hypothetical protein